MHRYGQVGYLDVDGLGAAKGRSLGNCKQLDTDGKAFIGMRNTIRLSVSLSEVCFQFYYRFCIIGINIIIFTKCNYLLKFMKIYMMIY